MKIRCYGTGWGDHEDLYNNKAKPSILSSVSRLISEGHTVSFDFYNSSEGMTGNRSRVMCENFISTLKKCISNNEYLFLLQPDTVYGAETFYNIATYGEGTGAYICVPHFRVNLEDFNKPLPMSNKDLIDYAWETAHFSTIHSNVNADYHQAEARLALYPCGEQTIMNHYYPTIYFFKPERDDIVLFETQKNCNGWASYDTGFLAHACKKKVRVIGSADMAFMVELEWKDSHHSDLDNTTRNIPNTVQGRDYSPYLLNTAYVINKNIKDMGQ